MKLLVSKITNAIKRNVLYHILVKIRLTSVLMEKEEGKAIKSKVGIFETYTCNRAAIF